MLKKLAARKADHLHVILKPGDGRLVVRFSHGKWVEKPDKPPPGKFSVRDAAAFALDTATSISDAAASGISSLLVETKTSEAVFDFIGRRVAEEFGAVSGAASTGGDAFSSRFVEPMSNVESTWLAGFLKPGEILLAWLKTSTPVPDAKKEEWRYLLTSRRAALAAFSKRRFLSLEELPDAPMSVTDALGRDVATVGGTSWRTLLSNDALFREIAPLTGLDPMERLHEAARLNYLGRDKNKMHLSCAISILDHLATFSDDPIHSLSRVFAAESQREGHGAEGVFDGMAPSPGLAGIPEKAPDNATPGDGAEGVFDGMAPSPGLAGIPEKAPDNATPGDRAEGVFDGMAPSPGLAGIPEKAPDNATPGDRAEGVFDGM
ncbi:MAG: hypothetical protein GY859_01995, partial [Desulfobacterales bacterium]|nr:hypothetical protein [Desulfobacterales bacterium]